MKMGLFAITKIRFRGVRSAEHTEQKIRRIRVCPKIKLTVMIGLLCCKRIVCKA